LNQHEESLNLIEKSENQRFSISQQVQVKNDKRYKLEQGKDERLVYWQEKYMLARNAYYLQLGNFEKFRDQYHGSPDLDKGKAAAHVWNFTYELVNSTVNSNIPPVKVTPRVMDARHMQNAKVIEQLCKSEIDRMPFEYINDMDERTCKIDGGSGFLIEWDNFQESFDRIGEINIRGLTASSVIPQPGVLGIEYMDYIFVTFTETKERIKAKYDVDVSEENLDYSDPSAIAQMHESNNLTNTSQNLVTQVVCYYRNKNGRTGCISWVLDKIIIDDDDYEARKSEICGNCGRPRPIDKKQKCFCGADMWEKRSKDFELVYHDIPLSDGRVIPSLTPVVGDDGSVQTFHVYDDTNTNKGDTNTIEADNTDSEDNLAEVAGNSSNEIAGISEQLQHEPVDNSATLPYVHQTQIPYYYPRRFPVVVRKNVSTDYEFLGKSDCDVIRVYQQNANRLYTKCMAKALKAGSYLTKPKNLNIRLSDNDVEPIDVDGPDQISMIRAVALDFVPEKDIALMHEEYQKAKSVLRITDSYQGKPDSTAQSGRAKEAQIAQSQQNQMSPLVMKQAAYANIYEMIFKFALAYMDEPRSYYGVGYDGKPIEYVFNRYDFLERDEAGNWRWDDGYLFDVDKTGTGVENMFELERLDSSFQNGAFGNPQDPETLLFYWRQQELLGVAGAKAGVQFWEDKIKKMQAQAQQQQIMQAQMQMAQQTQGMQSQQGPPGGQMMTNGRSGTIAPTGGMPPQQMTMGGGGMQ